MSWRLACVRTESAKDCGPAAVATVALHHGSRLNTLRLSDIAGTDLQGTSITSLKDLAQSLGFEAATGKLPARALAEVALPLIAHVDSKSIGHFVVVHRVSAAWVTFADPARGICRVRRSEFNSWWSGQVLLLRPTDRFRKQRPTRTAFDDALRLARAHRASLMAAAWLACALAVLAYSFAVFVRLIVDRIVPNADLDLLKFFGIGVAVTVLARVICDAARQYLLARVGLRLSLTLGLDYARHLIALPLRFFDSHQNGELFARFLDASKVAAAFSGPVLGVILDVGLLMVSGAFMLFLNAPLATVILSFLPVFLAVTLATTAVVRRREREIRSRFELLATRFVETIGNIWIVKASAAEDTAYSRIVGAFDSLQASMFARSRVTIGLGLLSTGLSGACSIALLWIGAQYAIERRVTTGELIFFYSILGLFLGATDRLAPAAAAIQEGAVGLDRLRDIALVDQEHVGPLFKFAACDSGHQIEFRNVTFYYRPGEPALSDIDLEIRSGETVAVLGETGSGKSTLISLINGLYMPQVGSVAVNGRNVRDLDKNSLRRNVALVMQEHGLIAGSIRDNIALSRREATQGKIEEAAMSAMAHSFISALPRGYEYEVGVGGTGLSAGQRQRIAIARALLQDPAILLLDEATGNLDPETEAAILAALQERDRRGITLIATHRIGIAAHLDRVIVLQGGRLIEAGRHEDLLALGGKYASMWNVFAAHADSPLQRTLESRHGTVSTGVSNG